MSRMSHTTIDELTIPFTKLLCAVFDIVPGMAYGVFFITSFGYG